VKTFQTTLKNALGVTGLVIAGYMIVTSLPDIRRYIRMIRM
jgi:uncharacterized protein DUF6893